MSKKGIFVVGLLLIVLAVVAQYTFDLVGVGAQDLRMERTSQYVTYSLDANPSFYSNNSRFFYFVTRTGIRYVPSSGEARWQETFSLGRPQIATRGDFVAVGEEGGQTIRVYNTGGLVDTVPLDNPSLGFSVNANGGIAVIMAVDGGYHVHGFNRGESANPFFRLHITHRENPMRFPVAAEVSDDGTYVAVAHLNIYRQMVTEVDFFAGQQARFGTEALFGSEDFTGEAFIAMRFMAGGRFLLITDSRISMQRIDGNSFREEWMVPLYNRIDRLAFCGDNRFAFVSGAASSPDGRNADPVGTVNIFDINGLTGRFYLGRRATHLSMGHGAVIVGADRYFHAVSARGASLWQHSALFDVRDMIFLENTNTVLIAGVNSAEVWRRQRTRNEG